MSTTDPDRPTVKLTPKAAVRAIRHGFPWVYDNEVVADRRTRKLAPGTVARLVDADRAPLATVAVNPASRLFCRVLDRDPEMRIDADWCDARVREALALRERLFDAPFYRLVHAEADGLPGVVVDRFGDALVVQPNAAWAEARLDELVDVLRAATGARAVVKNASGRARTLEGLGQDSAVLAGTVDAPVPVPMNGAVYLADLTGGQKTGLFFDQRPNHAFIGGLARGARVLDMFSHVGGFGLAAIAGEAVSAHLVDASEPALELAWAGALRMGVEQRVTTQRADAFDALETLGGEGAEFDIVVCDPPAFAPSKKALDAGLRAYERVARLAAPLVARGGFLCLCSCSHAADLNRFRTACVRGIGRAGRSARLIRTGFAGPDHPLHPQLAESGYLKALVFHLP